MTLLKLPGVDRPISTQSIIWLQGNRNYSWVHREGHSSHLVTETLKWFEGQIDFFIRVNKSALVNPQHVTLFKRLATSQGYIRLSDGTTLVVSRRRLKGVFSELDISV